MIVPIACRKQRTRPGVVWVGVALALACVASAAAHADDRLTCGVPLTRHLDPHTEDSYALALSADAAVVVDAGYLSGSPGYIELEASGVEATCAGSISVWHPADATVTVSDCIGDNGGDYTIVANVVSDTPQNCGRPMPCGLSPHVARLDVPGQVDAYTFVGRPGDSVTITGKDITGKIGGVSLRLFNPSGMLVIGGDTCDEVTTVELAESGTYTVLASACGLPRSGVYGIGFASPLCPPGPDITYFGAARADGVPQAPSAYDVQGRPVYDQNGGAGFVLVVEARPGPAGFAVGDSAYAFDPSSPDVLPDLQMVMSRRLGNGGRAVCDPTSSKDGVPGVYPFAFATTQTVADAINDFGCRVKNGMGNPHGVPDEDACTFFPDGEYHFVNPSSTLQFCAPISHALSFLSGDTILKARARDAQGYLGPEREIVIRVSVPPPCPGDCNGDSVVSIEELVNTMMIALGSSKLDSCLNADINGDDQVTVDEMIQAVNAALGHCG